MLVNMAIRALGRAVPGLKLAAVRVGVAGFAFLWRAFELNFGCSRENLVALAAGDIPVGAVQGKFRFGMVKTADIDPGFDGMACFAAQRGPIGSLGCHAILEFTLVGIHVASSARHVFKMEREDFVRPAGEAHFVAIRATDGHMRTRQDEPGVLVLGDGER
jgi:hypothetical protein